MIPNNRKKHPNKSRPVSSSVGTPNPVAMRRLLDAIDRVVREQEEKQKPTAEQANKVKGLVQ